MYIVKIVENHGHNGDEVATHKFDRYIDAWQYIKEYYFDNDPTKMRESEKDEDVWLCDEADAVISILDV